MAVRRPIWKYSKGKLKKDFATLLDNFEKAALLNLIYLGELCVNKARTSTAYQDHTANLRNSIGYVILKNGAVVKADFARSASPQPGVEVEADGVKVGRALAMQVAKQYGRGLVLIVVAGMNYAAKVESTGRDVLTSAEQLAETELPKMLTSLKIQLQAF